MQHSCALRDSRHCVLTPVCALQDIITGNTAVTGIWVGDVKDSVVKDNVASGGGRSEQDSIYITSDSEIVVSDNVADYLGVYHSTRAEIKGNTIDDKGDKTSYGMWISSDTDVTVANNTASYWIGMQDSVNTTNKNNYATSDWTYNSTNVDVESNEGA